jgi:histidinol-phosphate aminotransferase
MSAEMSAEEPQPHKYLDTLVPYQNNAGKVDDDGNCKIRLCYNEGAFGPSPKAIEAYRAAAGRLHTYPDMGYVHLRQALADHHNLDPARISCGAGSDDIISVLTRAYVREGDEVVYSQYGFSMYKIAAKTVGATPVAVPEIDMRTDLSAMLKAVTPRTRMVCLANPNNPTGSWLTREEITQFLRQLPPNILFLYDTAYADYMDEDDYSDGLEWAAEDSRVCVVRTFSKIHGLAGLRVGWAYSSTKISEALNRLRNPFNVSIAAEAAAIAALEDKEFIQKCREHTLLWRERLYSELISLGVKAWPSKGNFVLARMTSAEQAQKLIKYLCGYNLLIRPMPVYGLNDHIRISVGREHEMQALFTALRNFEDFKNAK